jgi:enoyl-CoA hydratase/carnithine racemase
MGVAVRFARDLAAKSSAVVSAIKQALYASATEPLDAMLRWEEEMQRQLFATDRARDAIRSFALPRKTDVS